MFKQIDNKHKWVNFESGESVTISQDKNNLYVTHRSKPDNNGIMDIISQKIFGSPLNKMQQKKALNYAKNKFNLELTEE